MECQYVKTHNKNNPIFFMDNNRDEKWILEKENHIIVSKYRSAFEESDDIWWNWKDILHYELSQDDKFWYTMWHPVYCALN